MVTNEVFLFNIIVNALIIILKCFNPLLSLFFLMYIGCSILGEWEAFCVASYILLCLCLSLFLLGESMSREGQGE